ncbi:MAG: DNA repair exonuclease [Gammaproteobacteria bacterium]|nr:DNA repair exonuclease [Gammaproteobacteria bacterium]MCY4218659.1 DNA repair exonuclease [Gammaproteobacteria bacterium]MCY4274793.1 DNA repair exonuclease [Gammaproteobacteria bacterium]
MSSTLTILAIGDIHLGTIPARLPENLSDAGLSKHDLSPATAWKCAVDYAIDQQVDAVLLAGDVVESTNARFEAIVPLEQGVQELINNNIQVIAVAGNHDTDALPRLAKLINGFHLLGEQGIWDKTTLSKNGRPIVAIIGWSFPERHVLDNPLAKLDQRALGLASSTICKIGLLHADLDVSGGPYAPVKTTDLRSIGFDAWLLGHIHKPSLPQFRGKPTKDAIGYLGSLIGLDPTETGPHGPWILKISSNGLEEIKQMPIAPLRWEHINISSDQVSNIEDLSDLLLDQTTKILQKIKDEGPVPDVLGIRATIIGRCSCHKEIQEWIDKREFEKIQRLVDKTWVFYNKIINLTDTKIDITEIATGDDPAALLAQRIVILENNHPEAKELIKQGRSVLESKTKDSRWEPVKDHRNSPDFLSDEYLRELLIRAGKNALHNMLDQIPDNNS